MYLGVVCTSACTYYVTRCILWPFHFLCVEESLFGTLLNTSAVLSMEERLTYTPARLSKDLQLGVEFTGSPIYTLRSYIQGENSLNFHKPMWVRGL